MILLDNVRIITPFIEISPGFLALQGRTIKFLGKKKEDSREYDFFKSKSSECIDLKGKICAPGFIDIHTHGALGLDYSNSPELLRDDSIFRASKGLTGFLPTIAAIVTPEDIFTSSEKIAGLIESGVKGAKPLGINLEGPYLYPDYAGAAGSEFCSYSIDLEYLKKAKRVLGGHLKVITISPELENSMEAIRFLSENGVVASIGHTAADYNTLDAAIRNGAKLVTHLYNTTLVPKQDIPGVFVPGVNEYLLMRDDIMAEVICDIKGVHVRPVVLEMIIRCKSVDKTIIITDSFTSPGAEQERFTMPDGREFYVKDGVNVQLSGQITGSAMTMDLSVRSMCRHTGIGLKEAIQMSSYNPARAIFMEHCKGSLEIGKDADIAVIDDNVNIYLTIVEGKIVFNRL